MFVDLAMGIAAVALGMLLVAFRRPLADHLQEGDARYRERFPWARSFEPQVGPLTSEAGRHLVFRGALLAAALAYAGVGVALALRALLG